MDKILKFIAAGDQDIILDEKERIKQLEVLIQYEMIALKRKRLFLTKKGAIAIKTGMDVFLEEFPLNKGTESSYCLKMNHYLKNWDKNRKISISVWIVVLLTGILLRHLVT